MDTDGDPLLPEVHGPIPRDRFGFVYMIFYLLGLGSLCPWNFFITASEYFKYKLRNTTIPEGADYLNPDSQTHLQTMFEGYITLASTIPNLLFNFITALLITRISLRRRMICSLSLTIVIFTLTVVLVRLRTDTWQLLFFLITLVTVIVVNACSSVMSASLFGLASLFPPRYTQATMTGQAMGGLFASVANIIALAAGNHVTDSGLGFFIAATLTATMSLGAYLLLYYISYSRYHIVEIGRTIAAEAVTAEDNAVLISPGNGCSYYCSILKKIWYEGFSVCFVFFVTLSCFPTIASSIISVQKGAGDWTEKYFSAFVCFLLFNAGDWTGRIIAAWIQFPTYHQKRSLVLLSVLRVVFIPLMMLCNVQPRTDTVVFNNDIYPVVFILLLGLTNGYFGTLAMMYGPRCVNQGLAESTGAIMSVCLTTGLVTGSLLSLLLMQSL